MSGSAGDQKYAARLRDLREELTRKGVDGFIVPRADEHMGEYVPPHAERLAWLTGFTGSAGSCVVLQDMAAVFTDGRYTSQIRDEVDANNYQYCHSTNQPPKDWIAEHLKGRQLAYDPWLHTPADVNRLKTACSNSGGQLIAMDCNLVDAIWVDQPDRPLGQVFVHDIEYAGETSADKRATISQTLTSDNIDAVVLTAPDSVDWLLNIRGHDVANAPLALAFAILHVGGAVDLFIDERKIDDDVRTHLGAQVSVHAPDGLGPALDDLGRRKCTIAFDSVAGTSWVLRRLLTAGANVTERTDPCQLPKSIRNAVELKGVKDAHIRDGAALVSFLAWLDREAHDGKVNEISAADALENMRKRDPLFLGPSFPTISGAGPNGAIVHYRVTDTSNRALEDGSLYLCDSGGQYRDGTTDVTRTVAIGNPSDEMRDRFTRVLKGHIALATAQFPEGVTGSQLDPLARRALWEVGLDYDHGTGHGVGSYLSVHEGPQRISKAHSAVALAPGMVISNEPGYYKDGAFGIRIENLTVVEQVPAPSGAEKELLGLFTLTLAPIDLNLINQTLLNPRERGWLDRYHQRVRDQITPLVDNQTAKWLAQATRPCINNKHG